MEVNHITIDNEDTITISSEENSFELVSSTYNNMGEKIDGAVTWSLVGDTECTVSIEDNVISFVDMKENENIFVKATADNGVYVTKELSIQPMAKVNLENVYLVDETYSLKGTLDTMIEAELNIAIEGETIYLEEVVNTKADGTFELTGMFSESYENQPVIIRISGEKLVKDFEFPNKYFGANWENDMLTSFNSKKDAVELEELISDYLLLNKYDDRFFKENKQGYIKRIIEIGSFENPDELQLFVKGLNMLYNINEANRQTIENDIAEEMDTLKTLGFDVASFNELSDEEKIEFYVKAAGITVETMDIMPKDISDSLNEIVNEIEENRKESNKNYGSSGTGGSGVSRKPISVGTGYSITPVTTQTAETLDNATIDVEQFEDAAEAEWAKEALLFLKTKNIMVGYENKVRPNANITRAEFTKLLVSCFDLQKRNSFSFADAEGKWYREYAEIAAGNGIVNGYEDGLFNGEECITREMMAVMLKRVIDFKNVELYNQNTTTKFVDETQISDYARDSVMFLYEKGIIMGMGNNIYAPSLSVTRAQAAQVLYNVLNNLNK